MLKIHNKKSGFNHRKMVVELGEKDFPAGLSFVAIFQVKTLQGFAFHTCFNHTHFKKLKEINSRVGCIHSPPGVTCM